MSATKIKKMVLILISGLLVALAVMYFFNHKTKHATSEDLSEITIGWIGPLTGSTKFLGSDNVNAIKLAIDQYNSSRRPGQPLIKLIIKNSPAGNKIVLQQYTELVRDNHAKLIFVTSSNDTIALAKYAAQDHVIIINPINSDHTLTNLSENVFLIAKPTESLASIQASYVISKHQMNVLVLYSTAHSFTATLATDFAKNLIATGGKAILRSYSPGTHDFRPLLAEGLANHVDAYLFSGYVEVGAAIKQARQMGIKEPIYTLSAIIDPVAQKNAEGFAEGVLFAYFTYLDGNRGLALKLFNEYKNKYGAPPMVEWTAMQGYDAANIAIEAINFVVNQQGDLISNIRKFLLNVKNYPGTSGDITIRPDGSVQGIYSSIYILKSGKAHKVKN